MPDLREETAGQTPKLEIDMKETKDVLLFVIKLGQAIDKSLANDGKITLMDAPNFFSVLSKLAPAIEGAKYIALEIKDMKDEDVAELKAFVKEELDLEDDKAELFIEDAFNIIISIWQAYTKHFKKSDDEEATD